MLAEEQVNLLNTNIATKADIEAVRSDLLKWMFGMMLAQGSIVVGLVVALVKWLP